MTDEELKAQAKEAWEQVLRHPKADLRTYLAMEGVQLKGGRKPVVKVCPFCQGDQSAALLEQDGGIFIFTCRHSSCPTGGAGMGISKYIQERNGCDWKDAKRILYELTGIEDPYERAKEEKRKPEARSQRPEEDKEKQQEEGNSTTESTEEEAGVAEEDTVEVIAFPTPEEQLAKLDEEMYPEDMAEAGDKPLDSPFMRIPSKGRTPHEAFWLEMELTPAHRAELKAKRGFTDEWIDANGFRSSVKGNKEKLEALLDDFPPRQLLRAGLATSWPGQEKLQIAQNLCGSRYDEEKEMRVDEEIIIIPYIDGEGRITGLRPHKSSLTNSAFRESDLSSQYLKETANLSTIYGEHLIQDRPPEWEHSCVICEGEFKAGALRQCGIPAIAFPGIMFLTQNRESGQAKELLKALLSRNNIMEIIVVFDNEDKSGKPEENRFEPQIHAQVTCLEMQDRGFRALYGDVPDSWRINGKADWDGRLGWHVKRAKTHEAGIAAAKAEFTALLRDRKNRKKKGKKPGHVAAIQEVDRQAYIFDRKQDIIQQGVNYWRYVPKIFSGGKYEMFIASEIQNYCPEEYYDDLRLKNLCEALRESVGCYYIPKPPTEELSTKLKNIRKEIKPRLEELEERGGLDKEAERELRGLRALKRAMDTIAYRFPKVFTTFTVESKYKIMVKTNEGTLVKDRLITIIDKNGRRSKPIQMPYEALRSAQEMRKFFASQGEYHCPTMNQDCCDFLFIHIDHRNYQKTIEAIDTYGFYKEGKFWLLGDCAAMDGKDFIFPDKSGIMWINGTGYRNSDNMASFTSKPPRLFPGIKDARQFYKEMDWKTEREETYGIWRNALEDAKETFGGYAGYMLPVGILQYMIHPEVMAEGFGKPSISIQAEKGSGKTKSMEFFMGLGGFSRDYGYVSLGGTKVGLERSLCQFSCIPLHIDEFRNRLATQQMLDIFRNCFNETALPKGTQSGNNSVRIVKPLTTPIITGEDTFTDAALRSRFLRLYLSKDVDNMEGDGESAPVTDMLRRGNRYKRIMERSVEYHRVARYLYKHRDQLAEKAIKLTKGFMEMPNVVMKMPDSRAREVFGIFFGTLVAIEEILSGKDLDSAEAETKLSLGEAFKWIVAHGSESSEETQAEVFRNRVFQDCVDMLNRPQAHNIKNMIRVWPGIKEKDGRIRPLQEITSTGGRLYVYVEFGSLFAEFTKDRRTLGKEMDIDVTNLRGELMQQPCWVPVPKRPAQGRHSFVVPGGGKGMKRWWVLDFKLLDPEMRAIFDEVLQKEIEEQGKYLASDGITPLEHPENDEEKLFI